MKKTRKHATEYTIDLNVTELSNWIVALVITVKDDMNHTAPAITWLIESFNVLFNVHHFGFFVNSSEAGHKSTLISLVTMNYKMGIVQGVRSLNWLIRG